MRDKKRGELISGYFTFVPFFWQEMCSPVWQGWSLNGVCCQTPVQRARKWWTFSGIELQSNKLKKDEVILIMLIINNDFALIYCRKCTSCLIFHLDRVQNSFSVAQHFLKY